MWTSRLWSAFHSFFETQGRLDTMLMVVYYCLLCMLRSDVRFNEPTGLGKIEIVHVGS